jgi:hypothetical protein
LAEHILGKDEVTGSIPVMGFIIVNSLLEQKSKGVEGQKVLITALLLCYTLEKEEIWQRLNLRG